MEDLISRATTHLGDILQHALCHTPNQHALVLFDEEAELTQALTAAYRRVLPGASFIDFASVSPAVILQRIDALAPGDLVILVQSANFRLNEFRLRIELFKRGLKTIEHTHLNRMSPEQAAIYVEALAYNPSYYRPLGRALKARVDAAKRVVVSCRDTELVYEGGMEETKMNIGDYSEMKNVGGTFPIGEVFSEAKELRMVNGQARIFGFASEDHIVRIYEPFIVDIHEGILTAAQGPKELQIILDKIREDEEVVVREFGLGLNPAMGKDVIVNDITAFERQKGLHLSLGAKHATYAKPGMNRKQGRYHVDIFVDAEKIAVDGETIYENGMFSDE